MKVTKGEAPHMQTGRPYTLDALSSKPTSYLLDSHSPATLPWPMERVKERMLSADWVAWLLRGQSQASQARPSLSCFSAHCCHGDWMPLSSAFYLEFSL